MSTQTFGPGALATPANAITIARVLVLPVLVVLIAAEGTEWVALSLWLVLVATDGADGYVARRQGTTRSGAFLDPLADKVLVLGAMYALVVQNRLWWLPVALMTVRELAISAYRSYVGRQGVSIPARGSAKIKTVVQDVAVALALVPATGSGWRNLIAVAMWAAVALSVFSGAQYLLDHRRVLRAM